MREAAADAKLPIVVPNPAHSQFIGRESQEPVEPTRALTAVRARQLMSLPTENSILGYRDRAAILKFFLYTGARLSTGCLPPGRRLSSGRGRRRAPDPGKRPRPKSNVPIGIHFAAATAIREYLDVSGTRLRPDVSAA